MGLNQEKKIPGLFGPSHITWKKQVSSVPLSNLSEKSLNKITNAIEFAKTNLNYKFELKKNLDKDEYLEWLKLYEKQISNKEAGNVYLYPEWYDKFAQKNDYGSIFIKDENSKIIGGVLVSRQKDSVSCSYRAHEYIHIKDSNLGSIIEYYIDVFAIENNAVNITRGSDPNCYGIRTSIGLHDFKEKHGYTPEALDGSYTYYPRYLVLLKAFEALITYTYDENKNLVKQELNAEELKKYTTDINQIITLV